MRGIHFVLKLSPGAISRMRDVRTVKAKNSWTARMLRIYFKSSF